MIQNDVRKFSKEEPDKRKLTLLHHVFPRRCGELTEPLTRAFYAYLEDSVLCLMGIMQNGITTKEFWKEI